MLLIVCSERLFGAGCGLGLQQTYILANERGASCSCHYFFAEKSYARCTGRCTSHCCNVENLLCRSHQCKPFGYPNCYLPILENYIPYQSLRHKHEIASVAAYSLTSFAVIVWVHNSLPSLLNMVIFMARLVRGPLKLRVAKLRWPT